MSPAEFDEGTQMEGQAASAEPQQYEVTVDGQRESVTMEELQGGYMKGSDYSQKTMALAEKQREIAEMEKFMGALSERPDIVNEIERMWNQTPQTPAQGDMVSGDNPTGTPGKPASPELQEIQRQNQWLMEKHYEQEARMEAQTLQGKHPDVDMEAIYKIANERKLVNLDDAYELLQYQKITATQEQAQASEGSHVEHTGGGGAPATGKPDVNKMSEPQMWEYVRGQLDNEP